MILTAAMTSDTPVYLADFTRVANKLKAHKLKMSQFPDFVKELMGYYTPDILKEHSSLTAEEKRIVSSPIYWWIENLHRSQKKHYLDWLFVNSTCRHIRASGKLLFFREKKFIITPSFLDRLASKKVVGMSTENADLALKYIQHVITFLPTSPSGFLGLPKYHKFTNLRVLKINIDDHPTSLLEADRILEVPQKEIPQELLDLLRTLDLKVDQLKLSFIGKRDFYIQIHDQLANMDEKYYPCLRLMIEIKAKRKALKKQLDAAPVVHKPSGSTSGS